jgi:hypothetical protein
MQGKNDVTKNQVIQEMIKTEETYNKQLGQLKEALSKPELTEGNVLLHQFSAQIVFFKDISDKFLLNVTQAVKPETTPDLRLKLQVQRMQLMKAFFSAYKTYVSLHEQYTKESPDSFNKLNEFIVNLSSNRLGLDAYLILPIQRGPRYALLVKETERNNDHMDDFNKKEFDSLKKLIADCLKMISPKKEGYKFGDYTRGFYSYLFPPQPVIDPAQSELSMKTLIQEFEEFKLFDVTP